MSQFRIGADGKLRALSPAKITLPDHNGAAPHTLIMDPSGHFLFVLNYRGSITRLRLSPGGGLVPMQTKPAAVSGIQGFSVAVDTRQSTFYVTSQTRMVNELLGGVDAFHLKRDGSLRGINISLPNNGCLSIGNKYAPFPPQQVLISVRTRSLYFLYPAMGLRSVITQYRVRQGGGLTALDPPQVQAPGTPQEAVIDPHSRYCYVSMLPQYQYQGGHPIETIRSF